MPMVIHDDFWAAAKAMPEKQRAAFVYALAAYSFEGVEPAGSPPWLPTFLVIKDRLEMGAKASEKGRRMANARWGKKNAQASGGSDAQAYAAAHAQAHAQASATQDAEKEKEKEKELPPYSPPEDHACAEPPFWLQCLGALNDALGTAYTTMPEKCRLTLERNEAAYSLGQVRDMVAYKRDGWANTKYRKALTPNTLFGPDHFEQYMHEAKDDAKEAQAYAEYDR
ncbi:hypothetical protein GMI70_07005 [Eggerthellaceae bacterium zg-893]|nr:hypothetical protein [Eggerthellaceae bacterium zg-893]